MPWEQELLLLLLLPLLLPLPCSRPPLDLERCLALDDSLADAHTSGNNTIPCSFSPRSESALEVSVVVEDVSSSAATFFLLPFLSSSFFSASRLSSVAVCVATLATASVPAAALLVLTVAEAQSHTNNRRNNVLRVAFDTSTRFTDDNFGATGATGCCVVAADCVVVWAAISVLCLDDTLRRNALLPERSGSGSLDGRRV
uniref:Secreted protein n=1 Tax=Ixodes ricinus TaxID=34613 RepID=A0A6B0V1M1_IXORI